MTAIRFVRVLFFFVLLFLASTLLGQQPIPPSKNTNDAIGQAGAAAAANREAYLAACRALASDFGVKLPITVTPPVPSGAVPGIDLKIDATKPDAGKSDTKPAKQVELPAELQPARDAVAAILAEDGKAVGSAVLVMKDKLLTTANLGTAKKLRLRFPGGAELPGEVSGSDKNVTILSLVNVSSGKREPVKLGEGTIGESVYAVASPYGAGETVVHTSISSNPVVKDVGRMFKLSSPVHVSNSGAALLNNQGQLVALVCSWPNVEETYALPIQAAGALLKE